MKKRTTPAKLFKNKFCGRSDCTLGFVHWHDAFLAGVVHVPPGPGTHIQGKSADAIIVDDPHAPADEVAGVFGNKTDALADKIAAAVKALPCNDDPEADRFAGKSPETVQFILLSERFSKVADRIDTLVSYDGASLAKIERTLEACWAHWENDQQRPAWAHDFGIWILAQIHSEADFKMLRSDLGLVNENITTLTGSIVERYNLANKRSQDIAAEVGRLPGFWTMLAASVVGSAVLLALVAGVIVLAVKI